MNMLLWLWTVVELMMHTVMISETIGALQRKGLICWKVSHSE
jgi:hypothetical protein